MVHHRSPAPASSDLRVPCPAPGGLRPIIPKRARPTRPPPRGGTARLPHVRRKENRNVGGTLKERTMRMESMELQHVVFETEEEGRIDAMWSDVRLHAGDIPDGWHCYAVRGAATAAGRHVASRNSMGQPRGRHRHARRPRPVARQERVDARHQGLVVHR